MIFIQVVLIIIAIISGLAGLLFASQATMGVALVGFGCLLAIFARLAQAGVHRAEATAATARKAAAPSTHQLVIDRQWEEKGQTSRGVSVEKRSES